MAGEPELDLRAELARIDRDRAETQKLAEETRKLIAESQKLSAEERKLTSESRHFDRQTWQPMAIALLALVASIIALVLRR